MKATLKIAIIGSIFTALSILGTGGHANKALYSNKGQCSKKVKVVLCQDLVQIKMGDFSS